MHIADQLRPVWPGRDAPQPGLVEVRDTHLGRSFRQPREQAAQSLINAGGRSQQAMMATIHAQVTVPEEAYPVGVLNRRAPLVGLLQWGQGGATFDAKIDLRTGVCASLVASTVQLSCIFERADADPDERALFADVSAAVVWGTRPGRARATRTLPKATIAIAGTSTFAVPAFAYAVTIFTPTAAFYAAASTSVITLHGGPLITDDPELSVLAGTLGPQPLTFDGLLLSGHTRFLSIANTTGALLPVQLTFALEL